MSKYPVLPYTSDSRLVRTGAPAFSPARFYPRMVGFLILFFSVIRMALAWIMPLGTDESYYWLYAQQLQWNYFDHPPLVAIWTRLFTLNLALDDFEFFNRLGSIAGSAMATWFMYKTAATLYTQKAGWYAAVLYNISPYAGLVAGLLIMPDSPQMICWTFSMWMFACILTKGQRWRHWLLFGMGVGLCIMSKVHGVFLWGGAGLYVLLHRRAWLLQSRLWASLLVTALVVSPILFWNLHHDFITYKFHSSRVVISGWGANWKSFTGELLGQIGFNHPVNFLLALIAITAGRHHIRQLMANLRYLLYTGLPLAGVLLLVSLFRTVYPHWSGPAYVSLMPVAAIYLARVRRGLLPPWLKTGLVLITAFMVCWPLLSRYYPGSWGVKEGYALGKGDVTLDRYGWKEAGQAFGRYYNSQVARGAVSSGTPLVCHYWWGAHVEYYFGRPYQIPMIGLGAVQQIHHYQWMNPLRMGQVNPGQAFCVVASDEYYNPALIYQAYYQTIKPVYTITNWRGGVPVRRFYVYRMSGWKGE